MNLTESEATRLAGLTIKAKSEGLSAREAPEFERLQRKASKCDIHNAPPPKRKKEKKAAAATAAATA